jgi:aquaporin Z
MPYTRSSRLSGGKEMQRMNDPLPKRLGAEFLGTFVLVFGGCGTAVITANFGQTGVGILGVALAFGLTVLVMAYAVGNV